MGRRGLRLHKDLFGSHVVEEKTKGRDGDLLALRDECLYHRYYYYSKLQQIPVIELVWKELGKEFFLTEETIPRIIGKYTVEIRRLMNEERGVDYLRKKYDWMKW